MVLGDTWKFIAVISSQDRDDGKSTSYCDVLVKGDYYETLKDVIEVEFLCTTIQMALFKYDWFNFLGRYLKKHPQ